MNRPSFAVRVAGSPVGSLVIWIGCAVMVFGWYGGHVHWWMGVAAIAAAMRTRTAVKGLRCYNAWAAEWGAMGAEDDAPAPSLPSAPRRGTGRSVITVAALLVPVLPLLSVNTTGGLSDGLMVVWFLDCLFLAVALIRSVVHRAIGRKAGKVGVKAEAARVRAAEAEPVVTCLVPPASSSPSRGDAVRDLPDYCARLIERGRA